jgi:hypothetical protein
MKQNLEFCIFEEVYHSEHLTTALRNEAEFGVLKISQLLFQEVYHSNHLLSVLKNETKFRFSKV